MYYVYILSTDDKHYIWYSWDIQKRLSEHQNKEVFTTKKYENIKLLWYFIKNTKTEAIKLENIIKRNWHVYYWINHPSFTKYQLE